MDSLPWIQVCKSVNIRKIKVQTFINITWKERLNSDAHQFHKYQQNGLCTYVLIHRYLGEWVIWLWLVRMYIVSTENCAQIVHRYLGECVVWLWLVGMYSVSIVECAHTYNKSVNVYYHYMKRTFKQWCSSIPAISPKLSIISNRKKDHDIWC
jgi:hypothetical protein